MKGSLRLRRKRFAIATVELALMLPLLVLFVFATMEACTMIHVKQTLHIAAYEAARTALVPKSTTAQVQYAANQILNDRKVKNATITITPAAFGAAATSSFIEVRISVPASDNLLSPAVFFSGKQLSGSCSMMKEY